MGSSHNRATVLAVVVLAATAAGCTRTVKPREFAGLEQALHGHWSSTRDVVLPAGSDPWDVSRGVEQEHVEIDRYIDARSEPKAWSEQEGERTWRTVSQDAATGDIVVETWPLAAPADASTTVLRFDRTQNRMWEQSPKNERGGRLRAWDYINDEAHP